MNLVCPIDNKDDAIQKVSAVVASGQSTGTFSGPTGGAVSYDGKLGSVSGYSSLSGSSTSNLAQLLSPPSKPNKPVGFGFAWLYLWIVVVTLGTVIGFIPMMIVMGIGSLLGAGVENPFVMIFSIISQWVGIIIVLGWLIFKDRQKKAKNEVVYLKEKLIWERAMAKWNRLYYCHKHDIVFDPENGETHTPTSLKEFLYQ